MNSQAHVGFPSRCFIDCQTGGSGFLDISKIENSSHEQAFPDSAVIALADPSTEAIRGVILGNVEDSLEIARILVTERGL